MRGINTTTRRTSIPTHTLRILISLTLRIRTIDHIRITAMDIIIGRTHISTDITHRIVMDRGTGKGRSFYYSGEYC